MKNADKKKLLKLLDECYPEADTELNFKGPYQLVVAVLLSAQCTDKKVNQVTPELFKQYPDFESLARGRLSKVERIIRPINYYKTKSKHLLGMAKMVLEKFEGSLPETHAELTSLPGVGRKTANVVLNELDIEPAFPVDTHVYRVSRRLGLASSENRNAVEDELRQAFDSKHWRPLHHQLILHGRRVCKAQRPLCSECSLSPLCPSSESSV